MKDGHPQEPGRRLNRLRGRGKAAARGAGRDRGGATCSHGPGKRTCPDCRSAIETGQAPEPDTSESGPGPEELDEARAMLDAYFRDLVEGRPVSRVEKARRSGRAGRGCPEGVAASPRPRDRVAGAS